MLGIRATKIMQPPSEEKGMFGYYIFHGHAYLAPGPPTMGEIFNKNLASTPTTLLHF